MNAGGPVTAVGAVDVVGAWTLVSYRDVDDTGGTTDGPLGPAPSGLLLYSPTGHMSVSMGRKDAPPSGDSFMGYAGRWRLADGAMVHEIDVSSHAHMRGTTQLRDVSLAGDLLTLGGTAQVGGRPQRRVLTWRRG
ncbi:MULTISPECIES: lipocalin-like domain-containing protein [unclassified Streptomyces]|uniref:lipocalin-like domain-containing protein n=1 Tax=unclassified Streptomyces TaxID=2593676 RepID=UPI0035D57E37